MAEKSILVPLGDPRLKEISEVVGNKTCNNILDYLAEKNGTVSDISTALEIPMNTTDYNIKKLVSAGLIEKISYFWSVKGKKMPVYKPSNKNIVISPKRTKSVLSMIVALGIMGLLALVLRWNLAADSVSVNVYPEEGAAKLMTEDYDRAYGAVELNPPVFEEESFLQSIDGWQWFLVGAWLAIFVFFVTSYISERRKHE